MPGMLTSLSPSARRARRAGLFAVTAATLALASVAAAAQQATPYGDLSGSHDTSASNTVVEQIGPPEARSPVRMDQQAPGSASAPPPVQIRERATSPSAIPQIASPAEDDQERVRQLTDPANSTTASRQLSDGKRSANAAAPLSSPAQGKPEGVVRLEGNDRCDPDSPQANTPACAHAIEKRAAEFTRPSPTELTPEQRLLIRQNATASEPTIQSTLRRIGRNDVDADDPDAQSVASIVLETAPPPPTPPAPDPTSDVNPDVPNEIVIETIIRALQP